MDRGIRTLLMMLVGLGGVLVTVFITDLLVKTIVGTLVICWLVACVWSLYDAYGKEEDGDRKFNQ